MRMANGGRQRRGGWQREWGCGRAGRRRGRKKRCWQCTLKTMPGKADKTGVGGRIGIAACMFQTMGGRRQLRTKQTEQQQPEAKGAAHAASATGVASQNMAKAFST